ncbi:MAG: hypothetical protein MHMPM18_000578 [Marteilia pararefringens]
MINDLGMPDLLLTLSVADNHWPRVRDFHARCIAQDTLGNQQQPAPTASLFELTKQNPRNSLLFGRESLQAYLSGVLPSIFPVMDTFTSFEFQKRGTLHTHSLLWLDERQVPTVRTTDFGNRSQRERLQGYLGKIMTSCVPLEDMQSDSTRTTTATSPSSMNDEDVIARLTESVHQVNRVSSATQDLDNLVRNLQMHQCRESYCKRNSSSNGKEKERSACSRARSTTTSMTRTEQSSSACKFGFPRKETNVQSAKFVRDELSSGP